MVKKKNAFTILLVSLLVWLLAFPVIWPSVSYAQRKVEISMSVWGMPWENNLYTDILIPRFEKANPSIKVNFFHFEQYFDKLPLLHAGGEAPDVMRCSIGWMPLWTSKGMFLPLNQFVDKDPDINLKDFHPTVLGGTTFDGKIYALPQDINFRGFFYNKKLFDKDGLAYPTYNWMWDDVRVASKKLTKGRNQYGFGAWWTADEFRVFLGRAGGRFWNDKKDKATFNSDAGVRTIKFFQELIGSGDFFFAPTVADRGGLGADKFFEQDKTAMHIDGMWRPPSLTKNAPDLDFGVVPIPAEKKGVPGEYQVNHAVCFGVSSQSKHPKEAYEFNKHLVNTESGLIYWQTTWVGPPARFSDINHPDFRKLIGIPGVVPGLKTEKQFDERAQWVLDVMNQKAAPTTVEFVTLNTTLANDRVTRALEEALVGKGDAKRVLDTAANAVNREIE